LIDLLAQSYHEAVDSMNEVRSDVISALLLFRTIAYTSESSTAMMLNLKSGDHPWATPAEALSDVLKGFPERLHEAWTKIDSASLKVRNEVDKYRKVHPTVTA